MERGYLCSQPCRIFSNGFKVNPGGNHPANNQSIFIPSYSIYFKFSDRNKRIPTNPLVFMLWRSFGKECFLCILMSPTVDLLRRSYGIETALVNQILGILLDHLQREGVDPLDAHTVRAIAQFMIERKDLVIKLLDYARKCESVNRPLNEPFFQENN